LEKQTGRDHFGDRLRCEDNIKMDVKEIGYEGVHLFYLDLDKGQ
jgi:hypothetical protein